MWRMNARLLGIKKKRRNQINQITKTTDRLPPDAGNSIRTAEVYDGVAGRGDWLALDCTGLLSVLWPSGQGKGTYSGNTLITLPPNRL